MKMHKVLRILIVSDIFIIGSFGLLQPIFSIFVIQGVAGATLSSVGLSLTIFLFVKALFQIIVGKWDDEEKGNRRELLTLLIGSMLISAVPLGFAFTTQLWQLYAIQLVHGLGAALSYPSWRIVFTRFMNKDREGYEWGIYDTIVSLATAAAAAMGGIIAQQLSFRFLFILISVMSFIGSAFIVIIFKQEFTRDTGKAKKHHVPIRHAPHHHRVR